MSDQIKPGDLVMVVKPSPCCGNTNKVGFVFKAESINDLPDGTYMLYAEPKRYTTPQPQQPIPTDDGLCDKTLRDRDYYHDMADKLAEAIAEHFGADIGEHSSANCPWDMALEVIKSAPQPRQQARGEPVKVCDGKEQYAFEEWAKSQHMNMAEHPLHYLFLDEKTNAARQGWKAAIQYCASAAPQTQQQASDTLSQDTSFGPIKVGNLPTANQDDYPDLGDWWVQLRIGPDNDEVLARVYGSTPQQAYERAVLLVKQQPQQNPEGYKLVPIDPTAQDIEGREIVEVITKAILFEDCGSTEDWQDNLNLGGAAIRAMVAHIPVEMGAEEWAELHVLRAERGPSDDGHNTWKEAAIAERTKRVTLTPKKEIVELAKEGLSVYTSPNQNEHKICAEIVRLGAMLEAAPEQAKPLCNHDWVDARNEHVKSGEVCLKCMSIRAAPWQEEQP